MSTQAFDWINYHARYKPDALAGIDLETGVQWTYSKLGERIIRLAWVLQHQFSVQDGDPVACLCRNKFDLLTLQFACWKTGAIYTPINWRQAAPELDAVIRDISPRILFMDSDFSFDTDSCTQIKLKESADPFGAFFEGLDCPENELRVVNYSDERILNLLYTSGTTGKPKGIPYTVSMINNIVAHSCIHAGVDSSSRTLVCAPLFHSAGLFAATSVTFYFGGAVFVSDGWDAKTCLKRLSDPELKVTHFNGVPAHFQQIAALPEFQDSSFPNIQMLGIGSAPISKELLDAWKDKGVLLSQSYGLTEAFGVSITPPYDAEKFLGSAGFPMMHTELRIVKDGQDAADNEVGEIWVRGPGVMSGYWRNPQASQEVFCDGWLKTGDLARRDQRGAIYIVDRLKDMIISGGENIYPAEIEVALTAHPDIIEAAIVGIEDSRWGEVPAAVISVRPGAEVCKNSLVKHCRSLIAGYKVPKHWFCLDRMPRTPQGKIPKPLLSEAIVFALAGKEQHVRLHAIKELELIDD